MDMPPDGVRLEKGEFDYENNVASSSIYIRMEFLRKVYGLLSMQLTLTTIVAATFAYTPVLRDAINSNPWLLVLNIILSTGLFSALYINRYKFPVNLFLLIGFTIMDAITIGVFISVYDAEVIVKAFALTLIITASLMIYAFQTKRNFTKMGAGLLIGLETVIGLELMNIFLGSNGLELALAGGSALLFCLFTVFDTQMMMKKLSPEEYILATINLYLDVLNLFLELLRLLGDRK